MFHTITHIGKPIGDHLIRCETCNLIHWFPLPNSATVAKYYEEDKFYNSFSPPDWFKKEQAEHKAGLWNPYYRYLWGLLDPALCPGKCNPVIDIGCGTGLFLDYLRKQGYIGIGIEPSETARQWSPIKDRIVSDTQFIPFHGNIILNLVLEHIPEPETWLRREVLPYLDGRLLVVVPNEFSLLQRAIGGDWFVSPVHVNYFQPDTLRAMLERLGLRVIHESATAPLELAIALGYDYRGNDTRGRKVHNWRLNMEKKYPDIFRVYRGLYKFFGIGREIIMVAERK